MLRHARKLFSLALLACCLPVLASAQDEPAAPGEPAAAEAAPAADPADPADPAEAVDEQQPQPAKGSMKELQQAVRKLRAERARSEPLEVVTARLQQVKPDGIVVRVAGTFTDPTIPPTFTIAGGKSVVVSGRGKSRWVDLRRGDLALVSYVKGPPPVARKVTLLAKPTDSTRMAALGIDPTKPRSRTFIGYIKKKEGDELHVLSPAPANQPRRRPEVKRFIRQEGTSVEVLRDSWDALVKGDRVQIHFQKGNPRPVDLLQVIRLGGEEPLPPGVATRIFDPRYDTSVKDVDGIGETGPVPYVPPRKLPTRKIKIPRQ